MRKELAILSLACFWILAQVLAGAQVNVVTYHYDNGRTGANLNETLLTPANVNSSQFGKLFSQSVDGIVAGQPLYLSNVTIPGKGVHNVVYVATQHDSVYAFDADSNQGGNASPLWQVSFVDPAAGITTIPASIAGCSTTTKFTEIGVVSTPVIDPNTGTLYVVAKTMENGAFVYHLHALDGATGQEKFNGPVVISASFTANNGQVVKFVDKGQMNRPGLLLANGNVYASFGSNGCNSSSHGWVIGYDAGTLQPSGAYTTSPNQHLAGIWHSGQGPAADSSGNIYVSTTEAPFDADTGGQDFGMSVIKITQGPGTLRETDYFTPFNQAYLSSKDLDLSACGVMALPDQPGPHSHLLIASGKEGTIYVLDRDNMGQYNPSADSQIVQEVRGVIGAMFSSPVMWNNMVYFAGDASPIMAFQLNNGQLSTPPVAQSIKLPGGYTPSISANGNQNGVFWVIDGGLLYALDATTLNILYKSNQAGTRDTLPTVSHFATEIVANGKLYVGTRQSVEVYGLLPALKTAAGNNQSATVATALAAPLQVQTFDPYSGTPFSGVTVNFSDGGKGGIFGSPTAVTDNTGLAGTTYTLPQKAGTWTITASSTGYGQAFFSATATPGSAAALARVSGNSQTAQVATPLPNAVVAKVADQYKNPVPGVAVNFSDGVAGGSFAQNPVFTNSAGQAAASYTTPTKAGSLKIVATTAGAPALTFFETASAGPASAVNVSSGNNQTAPPSSPLPQPLVVKVLDQYGNPVSGVAVTFDDGGTGGSFSANPVTTATNGKASVNYTTPGSSGSVTINATVNGVSSPATFTVTVQ